MFAPWRSQKSLRKHKDPITGNLLTASVVLIFNSMTISCKASDLLIQQIPDYSIPRLRQA